MRSMWYILPSLASVLWPTFIWKETLRFSGEKNTDTKIKPTIYIHVYKYTFLMATIASVSLSLALYTVANWGEKPEDSENKAHTSIKQQMGFVDISDQLTRAICFSLKKKKLKQQTKQTARTENVEILFCLPDPLRESPVSRIVLLCFSRQAPW